MTKLKTWNLAGKGKGRKLILDHNKKANDVLPGSLRREYPGQHLDKSLNEIETALRSAKGVEKKILGKAKKILEQADRLLQQLN